MTNKESDTKHAAVRKPTVNTSRISDCRDVETIASETTWLVQKTGVGAGCGAGMRGLSVMQAALLIAGEMAGIGLLALPGALAKTGWIGLPLIVLVCGIAAFGGSRLGECWAIIEERHPEMRRRQRNPYALIAYYALGKRGSVLVSVCVQVTLVGAGVVYLVLAAELAAELMRPLLPSTGLCLWLLYIALLLTPTLWLGSPKDFSFCGALAAGSTVLACLFFFIQTLNDAKPYQVHRYGIHGFEDFSLAFGTILFSFGGASTFPTIQNDMVEKKKFSKSIVIAFAAILLLYVPVTVAAYVVYGEGVAPNLVLSLTPTALTTMGNLLMCAHLVFAFVIFLNPVFQEWEQYFNVPHEFGWRHALLRSCLMLGMLAVGETVPQFSALQSLVGGSTVALLTYVLPSYCYMKLLEQQPGNDRSTPMYMKFVFWEIIAVGGIGGLAATYSAFSALLSNHMLLPCYLR